MREVPVALAQSKVIRDGIHAVRMRVYRQTGRKVDKQIDT